ncbi:MAG TPA: hypothetical protein PK821_02265 [Victivallales bacterium]|nr:hypothetical protein [Victivallales bacterium]
MPDDEKDLGDNSSSTQKIPRINAPLKKNIPVVCSWCKTIYKISEWSVDQGKRTGVSHGVCPKCLAQLEAKMTQPKKF